MRNVVMMVLICVLMLSAATYAWFTLSKNARVASLTMTVGQESSLMIAPDMDKASNAGVAGTYGNVLAFGEEITEGTSKTTYEIKFPLQPATVKTDNQVYSPKYDDTGVKVTGVELVSTNDYMTDSSVNASTKYYCYQTTFFLKTAGTVDVQVQLQKSTLENTYTEPSEGTYVVNTAAEKYGAAAVRISLTDDSTHTIVYEPLSKLDLDTNKQFESATDNRNDKADVIATTSKQLNNGAFDNDTQSVYLTVSPNGTRITMRIWLEGTDPQCVNQIMAEQLAGQIAFEVVETTSGN